jgi:hypothetical protein
MKRLNAGVGKFAPPDTAGGEERDHEERDEHEEKLGRAAAPVRGEAQDTLDEIHDFLLRQ